LWKKGGHRRGRKKGERRQGCFGAEGGFDFTISRGKKESQQDFVEKRGKKKRKTIRVGDE